MRDLGVGARGGGLLMRLGCCRLGPPGDKNEPIAHGKHHADAPTGGIPTRRGAAA